MQFILKSKYPSVQKKNNIFFIFYFFFLPVFCDASLDRPILSTAKPFY